MTDRQMTDENCAIGTYSIACSTPEIILLKHIYTELQAVQYCLSNIALL